MMGGEVRMMSFLVWPALDGSLHVRLDGSTSAACGVALRGERIPCDGSTRDVCPDCVNATPPGVYLTEFRVDGSEWANRVAAARGAEAEQHGRR
jgi:hypothetical protein